MRSSRTADLHAFAGHPRRRHAKYPPRCPSVLAACKLAGFDLIIVETSGIGQGGSAIVPLVDLSLYVMTPEFGAASQLEKIDMLDFADFVAINKFDRKRRGGCAARRAQAVPAKPREILQSPRACRCSAPWPRDSTTTDHRAVPGDAAAARDFGLARGPGSSPPVAVRESVARRAPSCRPSASRYLAEIAGTLRGFHADVAARCSLRASARRCGSPGTCLRIRRAGGRLRAMIGPGRRTRPRGTRTAEAMAGMRSRMRRKSMS